MRRGRTSNVTAKTNSSACGIFGNGDKPILNLDVEAGGRPPMLLVSNFKSRAAEGTREGPPPFGREGRGPRREKGAPSFLLFEKKSFGKGPRTFKGLGRGRWAGRDNSDRMGYESVVALANETMGRLTFLGAKPRKPPRYRHLGFQ